MRHGGVVLALAALGIAGAGSFGSREMLPGTPAGPGADAPVPVRQTALARVGGQEVGQDVIEGPPYNGKFTFVRLRYGGAGADLRSFGFGGRGRRGGGGRGGLAPWAHDYPRAETNFARILEATTLIDTYTEGASGRVLTLDDPELFKYPVASIIEVGYWNPTDEEVRSLRAWLLKGGFLIVDDTRQDRGFEFQNFETQMRRVLPGYEILLMPPEHEIYDSFFRIEDPQALVPPYGRHVPVYLGIFEDNDPVKGRVMVMINFNTDLQEYWEFSDRGYYPIDLSNEAYKFGINYLVYAFTH
jgi:hypothetical protein